VRTAVSLVVSESEAVRSAVDFGDGAGGAPPPPPPPVTMCPSVQWGSDRRSVARSVCSLGAAALAPFVGILCDGQ